MGKEKKPHVKRDAVGNLVVIVIIMFAANALVSMISGFIGDSENITAVSNIVSFLLSTVFVLLYVKKTCNKSIFGAFRQKRFDLFPLLFSVTGAISLFYIAIEICALLLSGNSTIESNSHGDIGLLFVIEAVIIGPVAEEIIFRFAAIESLKPAFLPSTVIVSVSAVFAFMHRYNIQGLVGILAISLVWALVCYYTGNVIYTITGHILYNALQLVDLRDVVFFGKPALYLKNGFIMYSIPWIAINAVILAAAGFYFFKYFKPKYIDTHKDERKL